MLIKVKRKHIANGERYMSHGCPIALALLEHFDSVRVDGGMIRANKMNKYVLQQQPRVVRNFIRRFDLGKPVNIIEFLLKD